MRRRVLLLLLSLTALPALGQSNVYHLDDEGAPVQVSAPPPGSDAAVMSDVRRLLADGQVSKARDTIDAWLEKNDRTANPYLPEAILLRGDCKLANGNEYLAMLDYEDIAKHYPASEVFSTALERELEVSVMYLNGLRRKLFGLVRLDSGVPIADEAIPRLYERMPGSRLAERGLLEWGDYYYRNRDLPMAGDIYDKFLELFPRSSSRSLTMQRLIYSNIAQFKGPRYDTSTLVDAKYQIDDFQREFPAQAEAAGLGPGLQARLEESRAAHDLLVAGWYFKRNDPISARLCLRRLAHKYPGTRAAKDALSILEAHAWPLDAASTPVPSGSPAAEETTPAPPAQPDERAIPAQGPTPPGAQPEHP